MPIETDKNTCSGQPRLEKTRIWVSHAIAHIEDMGLEEYVDEFDIPLAKVKEAIEYCMAEKCVGHAVRYCQGCSKYEGRGTDLWKVAKQIYEKEVKNKL